jgi:hypothetical protein
MPYAVAEVELTGALPEIALERGQDGFALLVRRRGRPIAFVLREHAAGGRLGVEELARVLAEEAGLPALREALADELAGGAPAAPAAHVPVLAPGAELDAGWERALAGALAEQPDAAVVAGPAIPRSLEGPEEIAAELALPERFGKLRVAPLGAVEPPMLSALRALAAAGAAAVRPDLGLPARPGDALAAALRAGLPVAYEPGLLARTPGGRDAAAVTAAAREQGTTAVALLAALAEGEPALRARARRRTVRWLAREAKLAAVRPEARQVSLAALAGGLTAAARSR